MGNVINTIGIKDVYESAFEDFAIPVLESAPNTTIQNRAQVSRSLKAIAGIERVMFRSVNLLQDEFGPNGEATFETDIKDSRIRFVGVWNPLSNGYGSYIQSTTTDSFMEVSFYGTGLNVIICAAGSAVDVRPTVDGGAEGSDIFSVVISTVTGNRQFSPNIVVPVVSGLTLGLHTVKLRVASSALEFTPNGIEILNERTNLAVYSGEGISNGRKSSLSALATSAFNAGVVGTKGARVLKYVYNDSLGSAVQEVDATALYLSNADHTNEEIARRVNFREFGGNRTDDFSTASGAAGARAFTLDDGTTSLVSNDASAGNAVGQPDYVGANGAGAFLTLTFVGTGLDLVSTWTGTSPVSGTLSIDGTAIYTGTLTPFESTSVRTIKIASGLPYGTHTFRYTKNAAGSGLGIGDFIIYQPKKPSIPEGALVVADYNLMADFVYNGSTSVDIMSQGVLRKQNMREYIYFGTWASPTLSGSYMSGWASSSSTAGSYFEYTFFGTGVVYRFGNNVGAQSFTVSIDGSTNLSSLTTALTATAGLSFTASTGVVTGSPAAGVFANSLRISGLPLGVHKIRVAYTSGATVGPHATEVITPIHINDSTLKIGSQSLKSISKYSAEKSIGSMGADLSKAKAWVTYDTSANKIMASKNVSAVIRLGTEYGVIYFDKPFKNTGYSVAGSAANGGTFVQFGTDNANVDRRYTGSCGWRVFDYNGTAGVTIISAIFFGELIDE